MAPDQRSPFLKAQDLFPPLEPYERGMLDVSGGHSLYWEQSGNAQGVAALFLHGGPGAGASPVFRRFFDPRHWRVVLFDQRGAGRSVPKAGIEANTTADLVADIEALRRHLGIERWLVFGGSWGSTLALAYGIAHPERCLGFVLRGVFLFRRAEVEWFLYRMGQIFPEAGRRFLEFLPAEERGDPLDAYHRRLIHPDRDVHLPAALSWCAYEEACSRLLPPPETAGRPASSGRAGEDALAMARLEAHYMMHGGFLEEGELLRGISVLKDHPAVIVQGRYDVVCPPATAYELAQAWPSCRLTMIPDAGHSAMEPPLRRALIQATQDFRHLR
ncbi:prolyl aminopeptidase [Telmatospirillum sp. J64-1]|uniref:prolyl aminopeptidase n=1 Tax=Telmatospirillum sp. J64-1 TaxID=2502183 RepID=UPI00115F32E1|nr:prolyl aminopeptidase [Telmatospirillum sp. J64-1]